jgi:hypothetical protein
MHLTEETPIATGPSATASPATADPTLLRQLACPLMRTCHLHLPAIAT